MSKPCKHHSIAIPGTGRGDGPCAVTCYECGIKFLPEDAFAVFGIEYKLTEAIANWHSPELALAYVDDALTLAVEARR